MRATAEKWAIGLYAGETPFSLQALANNPILSAHHITDLDADFIADPFMLQFKQQWYLFFETLPRRPPSIGKCSHEDNAKGVIGLAVSANGVDWKYHGTVLSEAWHLSYPYVFTWQGDFYLLPETLGAGCTRLYKAHRFPDRWLPCADLLRGRHADASPFYYQHRWWMFSCTEPEQHNRLALFFADHLFGPWHAHPSNPIIDNDASRARPAGRVIEWQGRCYRFAQDCTPRYGTQVRAFEITHLTATQYAEKEHPMSPILGPSGSGWNGRNMHHIDLHCLQDGAWLACVDGYPLDPG